MRFTVKRVDLESALTSALYFVAARQALPILGYFEFLVRGGMLEISSSNTIQNFWTCLSVQDADDGRILIPARRIVDLIKQLDDDSVLFHLNKEGMSIRSGGARATLNVSEDDFIKFPEAPDSKEGSCFECPSSLLKAVLEMAAIVAAEENKRPDYAGVCIDSGEDAHGVEFTSTDTYRLVYIQTGIAPEVRFENQLYVPIAAVESLLRVIAKDPVQVSWDGKHVFFTTPAFRLSTLRMDQSFPKFKTLLGVVCKSRVEIGNAELSKTLRRASLFVDPSSGQPSVATLYLKENVLYIDTDATGFGSLHEEVPVNGDAAEAQIMITCSYLADAIRRGGRSELLFPETSKEPLIIRQTDDKTVFRTLLLPVRKVADVQEESKQSSPPTPRDGVQNPAA